MWLRGLLSASACAAFVVSTPALAQAPIGSASRIEPSVAGVLGSRRVTLNAGASVHQNETVQTGPVGRAVLGFRDRTELDIGANASVKLDRFVYNGDATAREAVINMTRGAFRFVTGASNPAAFSLKTPHATLGIRGTVVEFAVGAPATDIYVQQGSALVCTNAAEPQCLPMIAGDRVSVTSSGFAFISPPQGPDPTRGNGAGGESVDGARGSGSSHSSSGT